MKNRFNTVPVESNTTILFQQKGKLCGYDIRYEIWSWDGIEAESIIFLNDDVAGLTDQEIETLVSIKSPHILPGFQQESSLFLTTTANQQV